MKSFLEFQRINEAEDLDESHLIHVSDGSKYNDKPNKKDVSHVMSGVKTHGGVYDNATDKGAIFKFKSHSDADNFKRHVDKCPGGSCYADHISEETELDEAKSVSDPYKNLPGKSTHMLNKDVRGVHGIIHMGTLLRHTGGDRYEVRAGKARGETLSLHKNHVMLPPDFDEEVDIAEGRMSQQHPLEGHPYHSKSDAELLHIAKDAHAAAGAMKDHNTSAENKYRDQASDSATVRHFRKTHGIADWYKKKYALKEEVDLDEETELDEAMSDAAHELVAHGDNDSHLFHSSHKPIVANLKKKVAKGTYDHEKAKKLWSYHADRTAQSYAKKHGDSKTPWHKQFTTADRKQAASHFADQARDEHLNEEQLDEADRIPFVNGRTHAQAGKMLPSMSKHMTVCQEHDYYHPKSGNKISGVVKHKSDTEVHMQANKGDRVGGGDTHKFTISEETPPWKTDSDSKKRKLTSFRKLNNPTRTGNDAARALAMRGLSAARKKVEEAISVKPNTVQKLKAALDRHTDLAVAANKAGDNDAVKVHQVNANKIKTKLGNLARNPNHYNESGTDAAKVPATNEEDLNELSHDKLTSYIRRAKHDERKNRSTGVVLAQKKKWGGLVSGTDAAKVPATNEEDKLIGKQKVLDKNRNGKLDAHDFKLLRKEESMDEGEDRKTGSMNRKLTYKEMVEGTFTYKDGVTTHRGDYGTSYYKDVAKDDKDDELNFKTKKTKTSANKPIARKSGRPVGSKSGARDRLKSDTPSYGGIAFHGYNGPTKI